jgi:serine/threonine protein kinase
MPGCLDEDVIMAFALGTLPESSLPKVDAHLDGCPRCREALSIISSAARTTGVRATAGTFSPGHRLGARYAIVRLIGRGGMGEVYEVEDQLLQERVALKTVAAVMSDDERAVRRFKREVLLARRVTHPNVCRIFDLGVDGDVVFLTMELVAGESLRTHLKRQGPLGPARAQPLITQIAGALEAAHAAGVVHRDFKSDNVLVATSPSGMRAVVTDFGLARSVREGDRTTTRPSITGAFIQGSATHIAPEQLEDGLVTAATDVYALGVVLFEIVTGGRLPFEGTSPADTAALRLRQPAPSPRVFVPDVDAGWETVIARCLDRQPARRFFSAAEVVAALSF